MKTIFHSKCLFFFFQIYQNKEMKMLPMLPMRGVTVFPGSVITLDVGREKSIAAVEAAMSGERKIFAIAQRDTMVEHPQIEDL